MYSPEDGSFAKQEVSDDVELISLGEKLPRLYSISDKFNRFRVRFYSCDSNF